MAVKDVKHKEEMESKGDDIKELKRQLLSSSQQCKKLEGKVMDNEVKHREEMTNKDTRHNEEMETRGETVTNLKKDQEEANKLYKSFMCLDLFTTKL